MRSSIDRAQYHNMIERTAIAAMARPPTKSYKAAETQPAPRAALCASGLGGQEYDSGSHPVLVPCVIYFLRLVEPLQFSSGSYQAHLRFHS